MAQHGTLPDPVWTSAADLCIGCGYSLRGLGAPGQCPECGRPFGSGQLVLAGIVNRSRAAPLGRRLAWVAVIGVGAVIAILWPVLLIFQALVLVILVVLTLGGLIALWVTGPRERRSVERLIFAPAGIARVAFRAAPSQNRLDTIFTPWEGANCVELKRVSAVWRRIRIHAVSPGSGSRVVFDAGIRCPDAAAGDVERAVRDLMTPQPGGPSTSAGTAGTGQGPS